MSSPIYTVGGQPAPTAVCGEVIGFDVPGYPQAWIIVYQDGRSTFDGPMNLPMSPYALRCPNDVGFFQVAAYEIVNGQRGNVIGQTSIRVTAPSQPIPGQLPPGNTLVPSPVPGSTPPRMGEPPYIIEGGVPYGPTFENEPEPESGFFGMDSTTLALLALGALVVLPPLLSRRKG